MEAWNSNGPNVVTIPEGAVEVKLAPVIEFIRRGPGGVPSHLDPKMDDGHSVVLRGLPEGEVEISGERLSIPSHLRITGIRVLARGALYQEAVFLRRNGRCIRKLSPLDPAVATAVETERVRDPRSGEQVEIQRSKYVVKPARLWNVIAEFELPEGRKRADEEFATKQAEAVAAARAARARRED